MVFTKNTAEHADMRAAKATEQIAENGVIADIPAADIAALTGTPAKTLANIVTQVDLVTTEVAKLTAIISGGKIPVNASGVTLTADLIDLDVEAITGSGAAAKTLADLVARLSELTRKAATWFAYRDAILTGNDTTPVGVDVSTAAGVAALLTGTTKTPIPVTGGSLYIRAASTANAAMSGYLVHRDAEGNGNAFMEPFTLVLDGSKDGALYVQTKGPFDISMDAEVELVFTSGDATAFSVWTRQM